MVTTEHQLKQSYLATFLQFTLIRITHSVYPNVFDEFLPVHKKKLSAETYNGDEFMLEKFGLSC